MSSTLMGNVGDSLKISQVYLHAKSPQFEAALHILGKCGVVGLKISAMLWKEKMQLLDLDTKLLTLKKTY
jgi:hypothetical protein